MLENAARTNIGNRIPSHIGIVRLVIWFMAATKAMARISPGIAKKMSHILIITSSTLPPKYPLMLPTMVPMMTVRVATVIPIFKDTLDPYTTLLNRSWP